MKLYEFNKPIKILEGRTPLFNKLTGSKANFVKIAQKIYDRWTSKKYGEGRCDDIADEIVWFINEHCYEWNVYAVPYGRNKAGTHAYAVAFNKLEAYLIDVPYKKYEVSKMMDTPYGFIPRWKKIENVRFTEKDIRIVSIQRQPFMRWRESTTKVNSIEQTHLYLKKAGVLREADFKTDSQGYRIPNSRRTDIHCSECGEIDNLEPCGTFKEVSDMICPTCRKRYDYRYCEPCGINHIKGACPQLGAMAGKIKGA